MPVIPGLIGPDGTVWLPGRVPWSDSAETRLVLRTADVEPVNASSYVTDSITIGGANRVTLLAVHAIQIAAQPNAPTISGPSGFDWVLVRNFAYDTVSTFRSVAVFAGTSASVVTGAITIDYGGQTQDTVQWAVIEADQINTNTNKGVVQSAQNVTGAGQTAITVTLGSPITDPANLSFGAFVSDGNFAFSPGASFAELSDQNAAPQASDGTLMTEWRAAPVTTAVNATSSTGATLAGIALELRALEGAPDYPYEVIRQTRRQCRAVRRGRIFDPPWTAAAPPSAPAYPYAILSRRQLRDFGRRGSWADPPWWQEIPDPVIRQTPRQCRAVRRGHRFDPPWPQRNPPYPFVIVGRRQLRDFGRRGSWADPPWAQQAAPSAPAYPWVIVVRRQLRDFGRRGRRFDPPWPQLNPPYPFGIIARSLRARGPRLHALRPRADPPWTAAAAPPAPAYPYVIVLRRQLRDFTHRGRRFDPPWPQRNPPYPFTILVRRQLRDFGRRGSWFDPPWIGLAPVVTGTPPERIYVIGPDPRTFIVLVEDRTFAVAAEGRSFIVVIEDRTLEVPAEQRTLTIDDDGNEGP